ncbi:PREDICTED: recQ-mediated genome instability protein 1-like isoform X1 [Camelina sativa]|uniref:RecQ-mediated genome instability protein 1 n=1 Tax=Camelina sativa TaxID=90675 RepID=A0ABM0UPR0_CAMSA|nr:PREDICTED: recQ-mediated genome instability protein 1-like isoform X1 [Camelina sativa]
MRRRRLQLRYSSDEEEEDEDGTGTSGIGDSVRSGGIASAVQPETSVASNSNPNPGEAIDVSEVEIIDVFGNPPPTPPDSSIPVDLSETESDFVSGNDYESPISEILCRLGIKLKREWWVSCLSGLEISIPQFFRLDVAAKAKHCFEQFMFSDMNICGGGVLPRNVSSMNLIELPGPFVLQVDEIVNIGCPLKGRYENANAGLKRCLKLSMTDGVQRVFGMEYRPIKDLQVLSPAGLKIVVSSVQVRHGLLMLVPEIVEVLGGMVEELEEARKRLVVEVNKPPRGKRIRRGVVPSLATRATLAAWSLNGNDAGNHVDSSTSANASNAQVNVQGIPVNVTGTHISSRVMGEPPASTNVEATVSRVEHMQIDTASAHGERTFSDIHSTSSNIHRAASTAGTRCSGTRSFSNSVGGNTWDQQTSNVASFVEEMHIDTGRVRDTTSHVHGSGSGGVADVEVSNMVIDLEGPSVVTNTEKPFTYLAELSQKWAVMKESMHSVQGRIKCFLTGVKKFQFKQQSTYELLCYVDDGSLICEILLHNDVVQNRIGHSSMEVTAALSSSAPTSLNAMMKEKLKRFQLFLADFEGIMVVEMNRSSQYPVAIEMNQGCSLTDARLLFERIKSSSSLNPVVVLSP